ncbi:hypothetical protein LDO26_14490 [Luteimonas sp. BDR2-5]|uniref:hypothetical protein n=1 Tax=Proluteimonas luteida TaxID=2878685 RepID=UPI001E3E6EAA|nr:hypothetical protein [Luteimonas sp. BDR2-5]MCD9029400.1 hypothetical protein [Luteimonas sp. BDR2-5]
MIDDLDLATTTATDTATAPRIPVQMEEAIQRVCQAQSALKIVGEYVESGEFDVDEFVVGQALLGLSSVLEQCYCTLMDNDEWAAAGLSFSFAPADTPGAPRV